MAPRIDREKIKEIHRLRDEGTPKNQICRQVGCTRETLERHYYDDDDEPGGYSRWMDDFSDRWCQVIGRLRYGR